ncbi:unnamed protein product [Soboliphyme baturini]|uniref:ATP synthase subunit b n=1 Tax=Soboliphyme baturini TaxID=241478 RepID=A0A183IQN8_9BILA|nr:unnamed protein product [Soboliphyme baturini]
MLVIRIVNSCKFLLRPQWLSHVLAPTSSATVCTSSAKLGATYIPDKTLQEMPKDFKENPELRPMYPPKARLLIFPDTWFQAFYQFTGVTGPYLLVGGLSLFIIQKELLGAQHEMIVFLSRLALFVYLGRKFGTYFARWAEYDVQDLEKYRDDRVNQHLNLMKNSVATSGQKIKCYSTVVPMVYEAKRENVALQLEVEYRKRLVAAHKEVKKRLDYMVDIVGVRREFQRRNLIDWVVNEVKKSITPERERETLQSCLVHLKQIADRSQLLV